MGSHWVERFFIKSFIGKQEIYALPKEGIFSKAFMIVHFILIVCFKVLHFCITKGPVSAGQEFHNNFNWTIVTGFAYMIFFFNFVHGKWHSLGPYDELICNIECYLTGVFIFLFKNACGFDTIIFTVIKLTFKLIDVLLER